MTQIKVMAQVSACALRAHVVAKDPLHVLKTLF